MFKVERIIVFLFVFLVGEIVAINVVEDARRSHDFRSIHGIASTRAQNVIEHERNNKHPLDGVVLPSFDVLVEARFGRAHERDIQLPKDLEKILVSSANPLPREEVSEVTNASSLSSIAVLGLVPFLFSAVHNLGRTRKPRHK